MDDFLCGHDFVLFLILDDDKHTKQRCFWIFERRLVVVVVVVNCIHAGDIHDDMRHDTFGFETSLFLCFVYFGRSFDLWGFVYLFGQ